MSADLENDAVLQGNNNDPDWNSLDFYFEANSGNKADNPMVGHATGSDIKPYSMRVLYLISY